MSDILRIFISFAPQDMFARNEVLAEARQRGSPRCDFREMTSNDPRNTTWRAECRNEIRSSDGVIAFISRHTPEAGDACWAISCAREEGIPIRGFWVHHNDPRGKPIELGDTPVVYWDWDNISGFIHSLELRPRSQVGPLSPEVDAFRKQPA